MMELEGTVHFTLAHILLQSTYLIQVFVCGCRSPLIIMLSDVTVRFNTHTPGVLANPFIQVKVSLLYTTIIIRQVYFTCLCLRPRGCVQLCTFKMVGDYTFSLLKQTLKSKQ